MRSDESSSLYLLVIDLFLFLMLSTELGGWVGETRRYLPSDKEEDRKKRIKQRGVGGRKGRRWKEEERATLIPD